MSTSIIQAADSRSIEQFNTTEAHVVVNQMTTVLEKMRMGQDKIQSMVSMLDNQPWWKRMLFTVTGKNKATVDEIERNRDNITGYISEAIGILIRRSDIQDVQLISIKEQVNKLNAELAVTNSNLDQALKATLAIRDQLLEAITQLSITLNDKLERVDNFHMLIEEITNKQYTEKYPKCVALLMIVGRIDKLIITDPRKMDILKTALERSETINNDCFPLSECISQIANSPSVVASEVYRILCCLDGNAFSELLTEVMEKYTFIPELEQKATLLPVLIESTCQKRNYDSSVLISSTELFNYFIPCREDYLNGLNCNVELSILYGNYKAVFPFIKDKAARQDARSIYLMSLFYEHGFNTVCCDNDEVTRFLSAGETSDDPLLKARYARKCLSADKEKQDKAFHKIRKPLQELAETGDPFAQTEFGLMLKYGQGIEQHVVDAKDWLQKAALQSYAIAQFELGKLYDGELKDEPLFDLNDEIAAEWYEKAAFQGVAIAQDYMGYSYKTGIGREKSLTQARQWYEKAAKQGFEPAKKSLEEFE